MSKRKAAITIITCDVFENGRLTNIGMRAYVENHISRQALNEAMDTGMRLREREVKNGVTEFKANQTLLCGGQKPA